jgi:hypothetical protein
MYGVLTKEKKHHLHKQFIPRNNVTEMKLHIITCPVSDYNKHREVILQKTLSPMTKHFTMEYKKNHCRCPFLIITIKNRIFSQFTIIITTFYNYN